MTEGTVAMSALDNTAASQVRAELAALRVRVAGVTGCAVAGVDGLVILDDSAGGADVFNVAALAAAMAGISRQVGYTLDQGKYLDCVIHGQDGYFVVYSVSDEALLAVQGDANLNVAALHLETRGVITRLGRMLRDSDLIEASPLLLPRAG